MISSSNVEKHNAFQWFQAQMLKNIMLFNDFKLKCWKTTCFFMISSSNVEKHTAFHDVKLKCRKTQCFSMISSSNVKKHYAFPWFQAQMLKNTMFFDDFKIKCWKTQCFSMISSSHVEKHNVPQTQLAGRGSYFLSKELLLCVRISRARE